MKDKVKKYISNIVIMIIICLISVSPISLGRLVDIPVPPNSSGYADFTEEEAAQKAKEYEESKKNEVTAEYYVNKSSNNYLESLEIKGYNLSPKFNKQNDTYTIKVKKSDIKTFEVTAKAEDEKAKIDGIGKTTITEQEKSINIIVTAENGNIKAYTINVEYKEDEQNSRPEEEQIEKEETKNIALIVGIAVVTVLLIAILFKKRKK